jgi:hypothetical protein
VPLWSMVYQRRWQPEKLTGAWLAGTVGALKLAVAVRGGRVSHDDPPRVWHEASGRRSEASNEEERWRRISLSGEATWSVEV